MSLLTCNCFIILFFPLRTSRKIVLTISVKGSSIGKLCHRSVSWNWHISKYGVSYDLLIDTIYQGKCLNISSLSVFNHRRDNGYCQMLFLHLLRKYKSFIFILSVYSILHWVSSFHVCVCKVSQSCPTLCDPVDCSFPGSSVHGILRARILEWVAISFSRGSFQPRDRTRVSCIAGRHFILWVTREAIKLS